MQRISGLSPSAYGSYTPEAFMKWVLAIPVEFCKLSCQIRMREIAYSRTCILIFKAIPDGLVLRWDSAVEKRERTVP